MAEVLFLVGSSSNPDPDLDRHAWKTGHPVAVLENDHVYGLAECLPRFIKVKIPTATVDEVRPYLVPWNRILDWEFVGHNYSIDGHRFRLFVKPEYVSASGLNGITRNQAETYLNKWGGSVHSAAANEVVFDMIVIDVVKSEGFWDRETIMLQFTELSYDSETGVHQIEVDYTNDPVVSNMTKANIEKRIKFKGGEIVSHEGNSVTFTITRNAVFEVFKQDIKERLENAYAIRKFKIPEAAVQMVVNQGGEVTVTKAQFINYLHNLLDD